MTNFLVNPEDGTINIHYDGLDVSQVEALIKRLEANVALLKRRHRDPMQIMRQTLRRNRATNEITFLLDWDAEVMRVDLDQEEFKVLTPNVPLTPEQYAEYEAFFFQMIDR